MVVLGQPPPGSISMGSLNAPLPSSLRADADEVIRVGDTRVTLDTIVARFHQGDAAEQIAIDFPLLDLADVYSVIAFYLRHQAEVDAYLRQERQEGDALRQQWARTSSVGEIRARLLARQTLGEERGAAAAER